MNYRQEVIKAKYYKIHRLIGNNLISSLNQYIPRRKYNENSLADDVI